MTGDARLIRVAEDFVERMRLRTDEGWLITVTWGEPDTDGVYEPILTATDDGCVLVRAGVLDRLRKIEAAARLVSEWHDSIGTGPIEELDAELGELHALTHPEAER